MNNPLVYPDDAEISRLTLISAQLEGIDLTTDQLAQAVEQWTPAIAAAWQAHEATSTNISSPATNRRNGERRGA